MKASALEIKVMDIVRPVVEDLGFRLVWVRVANENRGQTVQITAENPDTGKLGIDDCTLISRSVSAVLDVEDPIEGSYMLEVSSPGIDRTLYTERDYRDFIGFEAKVELDTAIDGQRRYRGVIRDASEGRVVLNNENKDFELPINEVRKARLVLTDDLIEATSGKGSAS